MIFCYRSCSNHQIRPSYSWHKQTLQEFIQPTITFSKWIMKTPQKYLKTFQAKSVWICSSSSANVSHKQINTGWENKLDDKALKL